MITRAVLIVLLVTSVLAFSAPAQQVNAEDIDFGSPIALDDGVGYSSRPQLAVLGSDVYTVWMDPVRDPKTDLAYWKNDISFRVSHDDGATWGSTLNLSNDSGNSKYPALAVYGNSVYVAWTNDPVGNEDSRDVFFRASNDNGATWSSVINLSDSDTLSYAHRVAASGSDVCVAWVENYLDGDRNVHDTYFRISNDNGATFGPLIGPNGSPDNPLCSPGNPYVIASGNYVYKLWIYSYFDPTRVYQLMFARSTDYGTTFEPTIILDTVPAKYAGGSEMQSPIIRVSGNNIHVAWSAMHDTESDVFFRMSNDNGATFGDTVNLSNNSGGSWLIGMHASGNNVLVLWRDSTWGFSDLYFRASVDSGASFGSTINISNNIGNVAQATWSVNGDYIHILWMDDGADYGRYGDHEIFYARSPPISPSDSAPESLDVSIDVIPSSDQNVVDCSTSKGVVKVLILSEDGFSADTVDVSTVDLEGIAVHKNKIRLKDFDGDGDADALVKFKKASLCEYINLSIQSVGITLYGRTNDGHQFKGTDSILA